MTTSAVFASLILFATCTAFAADAPAPPPQGWAGNGEAGLASASGNTHAENLNAKFVLKYNDSRWKNEVYASTLRNRGNVTTTQSVASANSAAVVTTRYQTTAARFEGGASSGYKLGDHSYFVGAARYERDEFSPYRDQSIASLGYGCQVLRNARNELALEVGGGYKSALASDALAATMHVNADSQNGAAARGKVEYKYSFNATTSFSNTYLVESTSANTFVQNDAGLQVKMTHSIGLKAAYEVRHNSDVLPGFHNTDQLLTTNLVYSF